MKNKYLLTALTALALMTSSLFSQSIITDFENFSLPAQSWYQDSTGADFSANNIVFQYDWDQSWNYWSGGFSYSNVTDSSTSGFSNMYAAKAFTGNNGSSTYAIAQNYSYMKLIPQPGYSISGFYITNTTYAANSMRDGDGFAKQFGGPTGNDSDWFKLTVFGYIGGTMIGDSVEFYLADYRFSNNSQDYIVKDWQYLDLTQLTNADSLTFQLSSSDVGAFGMNTPAYFAMDDFMQPHLIGIREQSENNTVALYPNPASDVATISLDEATSGSYSIADVNGKLLSSGTFHDRNNIALPLSGMEKGVYVVRLTTGKNIFVKKLIKE